MYFYPNISGFIHTELKHSLWIECCVCPDNKIHEVVVNKLFDILLSNASAVGKTLSKMMVICYATRSPVTHLAVTGDMAAGIRESLNLMVVQATVATIRQPPTDGTYQSFAVPDEEITNFKHTN